MGGQVIMIDAVREFWRGLNVAAALIQIGVGDDHAVFALWSVDRKAIKQHADHCGVGCCRLVHGHCHAGRRGMVVVGIAPLQRVAVAIVKEFRAVLFVLVVHGHDRALGVFIVVEKRRAADHHADHAKGGVGCGLGVYRHKRDRDVDGRFHHIAFGRNDLEFGEGLLLANWYQIGVGQVVVWQAVGDVAHRGAVSGDGHVAAPLGRVDGSLGGNLREGGGAR